MKINIKKAVFNPVTITLENQSEVSFFADLLGAVHGESHKGYEEVIDSYSLFTELDNLSQGCKRNSFELTKNDD